MEKIGFTFKIFNDSKEEMTFISIPIPNNKIVIFPFLSSIRPRKSEKYFSLFEKKTLYIKDRNDVGKWHSDLQIKAGDSLVYREGYFHHKNKISKNKKLKTNI